MRRLLCLLLGHESMGDRLDHLGEQDQAYLYDDMQLRHRRGLGRDECVRCGTKMEALPWLLLGVCVAALLLFSCVSEAATVWVSPVRGTSLDSTTYSGADSADANARSLAWFNARAKPGDVCRFKSGAYVSPIAPVNSGSATDRIRYYGFSADPQGARVTNIQFGPTGGGYSTARYFQTTSAFSGCVASLSSYPVGDSVTHCVSSVANNLGLDGQDAMFTDLTLTGTLVQTGGQARWVHFAAEYEHVGCVATFTALSSGNMLKNSSLTLTKSGTGDFHAILGKVARYNTVFNNTFNLTVNAATGYFFLCEFYESRFNLHQDNTWNVTMNVTPDGSRGGFSHRDNSFGNRYVHNTLTISGATTVNATGSRGASFMYSNAGSCTGSTHENYLGFNTIKVENPQDGVGVFWFQNGSRADTIEHNVIATSSDQPCLSILDGAGGISGSVFRHNTFFTAGARAIDMTSGPRLAPRFASNVFYCQTANDASNAILTVKGGMGLDSAGTFFAPAGSSGHAIKYDNVFGTPGSGGSFGGTASVWGSPRLTDSTYATLNALADPTAYAVSNNFVDGFAGVGVNSADVTAPAVTVVVPAADTSYFWSESETLPLEWTASDAVGVTAVDIDWGYGTYPTTWTPVVAGLSGATTTYNWVLPSFTIGRITVRIRARDLAGNVLPVTGLFRANVSPEDDSGPDVIDP